MRVSHDVVVAAAPDAVWRSLTDVDSVLAALPSAALARDGEVAGGSLKCRLGATQVTYRLSARAETGEPGFHTAVLTVAGKEARGSGTIAATLTVAARAAGEDTRIEVTGDIEATGRGAGADADVWQRVLKTLLDALVPPVVAAPAAAPPPRQPRQPLTVVPPPMPPGANEQRSTTWLPVAGVLLVLLLLVRRRRSRAADRK